MEPTATITLALTRAELWHFHELLFPVGESSGKRWDFLVELRTTVMEAIDCLPVEQ